MANIGIGKFGQTIRFDIGINSGTNDGGNYDAPLLFNKLFELNPDNNYYIISRSNWSRLDDSVRKILNKNNNVFDILPGSCDFKSGYNYLVENDVKLDYCILFNGISTRYNITGTMQYEDGKTNTALVSHFNYSAPIVYLLDKTNVPWFGIATDPRYCPLTTRDITNLPKFILSQINKTVKFECYEDFDPDIVNVRTDLHLIEKDVPVYYAGVETIMAIDDVLSNSKEFNTKPVVKRKSMFYMMTKPKTDDLKTKTTSDVVIVANQNKFCKLNRLAEIKNYIGDDPVDVYGKYDDDSIFSDERFKGPLKLDELYKALKSYKYTLIVPVEYDWATSKYIECINNNLLPFFHPVYDTQKNVKIPEFLRVNSPAEFHEKVEEVSTNEDLYNRLMSECKQLVNDNIKSGKYMNDLINEYVARLSKC